MVLCDRTYFCRLSVLTLNACALSFAHLVSSALPQVLDRDGTGEVGVEDLVDRYDTSRHPDVISGRAKPDQVSVLPRAAQLNTAVCRSSASMDDYRWWWNPGCGSACRVNPLPPAHAFSTPLQVLRQFLDGFDGGNHDGRVTGKEFQRYYATISASIDDDDYFELMIRCVRAVECAS
jgi:hypothetical protein